MREGFDSEGSPVEHEVKWVDFGREPKCEPNPVYPDGCGIDLAQGSGEKTCSISLPYPARRCGAYLVACQTCGLAVAITTAGRSDDPRSVIMPCKTAGKQNASARTE